MFPVTALLAKVIIDAPGARPRFPGVLPIAPATGPSASGSTSPHAAFARDFTRSFAAIPGASFHLAASPAGDLWAVQVGAAPTTAISWRPADGQPRLFGVRPFADGLQSRRDVPLREYTGQQVLDDSTPSTLHSYENVDLDAWLRTALSALDDVLASPLRDRLALLHEMHGAPDVVAALADARWRLAGPLSESMIPLVKGEGVPAPALDAMRRQFRRALQQRAGAYQDVRLGVALPIALTASPARRAEMQEVPTLVGVLASTGDEASLTDAGIPMPHANGIGTPGLYALVRGASRRPGVATAPRFVPGGIVLDAAVFDFVDPAGASELAGSFGSVTLPLPTRDTPVPPLLAAQAATTGVDGGAHAPSASVLESLVRWEYAFGVSREWLAHDVLHVSLSLDGSDAAVAIESSPVAAPSFDALAQFVSAFPAIRADLDACLPTLAKAATIPAHIARARIAAESAVNVVGWVVDAIASPLPESAPRPVASAGARPESFTIAERSASVTLADGTVDALYIEVAVPETWPPGVGIPIVDVDGWERVDIHSTASSAKYSYRDRVSGVHLTADAARSLHWRRVRVPLRDVVEHQCASAGVVVTRNEQICGVVPDDPFVRSTPPVSFAASVAPAALASEPLDIGALGIVPGALDAQLRALLDALLGRTGTRDVQVTLEAAYEYEIAPGLNTSVPVARFQGAVGTGAHAVQRARAAAEWAGQLDGWRAAMQPSTSGARYVLDLAISPATSQDAAPLLRIVRLQIPVVTAA